MSESLSMQRRRRPGIVPGLLVSLALHAVLLFGYRLSALPAPPDRPPNRTMTVWLQPLPPPASAIPSPPEAAASARHERSAAHQDAKSGPDRQRQQGAAASEGTPAAVTPAAAADSTVAADTGKPGAAEYDPLRAPAEPKPFDMEAARKAARQVAVEKPAAGTLAAQLQAHPLYPEDQETPLQKNIARAKRADCLTATAGAGILAPLVWLLDKKDSGCKF